MNYECVQIQRQYIQLYMSKSKVLPSLKRVSRRTTQSVQIPQDIRNLLKIVHKSVAIGQNPITELGLKWKNEQDYDQLKYILQDILQYPSIDLTDLHKDCNRLGTLDILENQSLVTQMFFDNEQPEIYCPCCGYLLQSQQIPLSTSLREIGNLGVSTHLYFQNLIVTSILFILLFLVYGVFSLVTNVIAYQNIPNQQIVPEQANFLKISLSAKQLYQTQQNNKFYFIQCWLGLATSLLFCIVFIIIKYIEKNDQNLIDNTTISASDFSVIIKGVPTKITKNQIIAQIQAYYQNLRQDQKLKQIDRPFKIAKINIAIPFYLTMDELTTYEIKVMLEQKKAMRKKFISLIQERITSDIFSVQKKQRLQLYNRFRELQSQISIHYKSNVDQIVKKMKQNKNQSATTYAFVTFQNSYAKELFCHLNSPQDTILRTTKNNFKCCKNNSNFTIEFEGEDYMTTVKSAPEPEDIIWTNIGQTFCQTLKRKLFTYSITFLILAASFVIIFLLSREQLNNSDDAFLSFIISFSITVINILLQGNFLINQVVMRVLTNIQREQTQTKFQTGLALKSIFAQVLNSILVPFIVKYFLQNKNLYHAQGLSYVIFTLGITNSLILPLVRLINLENIVYNIKSWYNKKLLNRLHLTQGQLNEVNTLNTFQIGNQYIYPVNLYLFVCFYASLQPIICIFGLVGLILMFWIQKHALFKRSKRPFPGKDTISRTMYRVMYAGPFLFSFGNLMWSNVIQTGGPKTALIPNLISLGITSVFMIIPYKAFFLTFIQQQFGKQMIFKDQRIFLASQYDRLNPATAKKAMIEYCKFIREYKQQIENIGKEDILKISEMLRSQTQKGSIMQNKALSLLSGYILQQTTKDQKREQEEQSHLTFEENHIIIKEDGIEQLRVKKQKQKKDAITSEKLLKQLFFNHNKIEFVQNWGQQKVSEGNPLLNQIFNIKIQGKQNKQAQRINDQNQIIQHLQLPKVPGQQSSKKLPQFNIKKKVQRTSISYDLLKNILVNYEQKIKESQKMRSSGVQEPKNNQTNKNSIQNQQKMKREESGLQLQSNLSAKSEGGLLSMILNSGNITGRQDK